MANFGELVLVLGDMHIPDRSTSIAPSFKRMLVPNKMQHVLCTGNVGTSASDLKQLAPSVHIVASDYDDNSNNNAQYPETAVVQVGAFRIGLIHGHQLVPIKSKEAIDAMRRKLQVDILVTGHTHQSSVEEADGCYHINPGSITGAYSSITKDVTPSFILLAVQDTKVVCYVYELINDQVEVSKTEFTKKVEEAMSASSNPALLSTLLK